MANNKILYDDCTSYKNKFLLLYSFGFGQMIMSLVWERSLWVTMTLNVVFCSELYSFLFRALKTQITVSYYKPIYLCWFLFNTKSTLCEKNMDRL